jgi:DNA ligase-1
MKPMLCANDVKVEDILFPCYVSLKLDGIRGVVIDDRALTRSLLDVPNLHSRELLSKPMFNGLDGEYIFGNPASPTCYSDTYSAVMGQQGASRVDFYIFDKWDEPGDFRRRYHVLQEMKAAGYMPPFIKFLDQQLVECREQLIAIYSAYVEAGHEGVVTKAPDGPYKYGRSTAAQNWMCKLKPRDDSECVIIGYEEMLHNDNQATTDGLGNTKRSTKAEGMRKAGMLGKFLVRDIYSGVEFKLGGGKVFTKKFRQDAWLVIDTYLGKIGKYSFCPIGVKDKPRIPTLDGWRHAADMG